MATRNQVLSLFGASPEQIMAKQAQEQARMVQQIQNPYQQTGMAIGTMLGRALGGESPEVTRQRELYSMLEGIDFQDMQPAQLREAAASLASQFPDRALQLLSMADQYETREQQRATSAAQQAQAEAAVETVSVPFMEERVVVDPLTQQSRIEYSPTTIEVGRNEVDYYRDLFKTQTQGGGASRTDTGATAIPADAVRFNTGVGAPVALVGEDYFIITDEETLGPRVANIKDLGGLVDPQKVTKNSVSSSPQQRKAQREAQETVTQPSTTTTSAGQMGRNLRPQVVEEKEEQTQQRSNRRRSNAR